MIWLAPLGFGVMMAVVALALGYTAVGAVVVGVSAALLTAGLLAYRRRLGP